MVDLWPDYINDANFRSKEITQLTSMKWCESTQTGQTRTHKDMSALSSKIKQCSDNINPMWCWYSRDYEMIAPFSQVPTYVSPFISPYLFPPSFFFLPSFFLSFFLSFLLFLSSFLQCLYLSFLIQQGLIDFSPSPTLLNFSLLPDLPFRILRINRLISGISPHFSFSIIRQFYWCALESVHSIKQK